MIEELENLDNSSEVLENPNIDKIREIQQKFNNLNNKSMSSNSSYEMQIKMSGDEGEEQKNGS